MNYIATIQLLGHSPKEIASELRIIADRIESQGTMEQHDDNNAIVHVRDWKSGGEEPIDAGRFWSVGHCEGEPGNVVALFSEKAHAERMAEGKPIFDDEDGPMNDLCVTRARVVGTFWNSFDPDPEDSR